MFINVTNNSRVIYVTLTAIKAKRYSLFVVILLEAVSPPFTGRTALQNVPPKPTSTAVIQGPGVKEARRTEADRLAGMEEDTNA